MIRVLTLLLILGGCSAPGAASHVPPLVLWPLAAAQSAVSNSVYDARRNRVKEHAGARYSMILRDADLGAGPALARAAELANVPASKQVALVQSLRSPGPHRNAPSLPERVEAMTVILMVHGGR